MYKYVIKRILLTIPVLLGAVFLVFTIMYLTPGDPGTLILGITAKPEDIAALNHKLGADLPFFEQFFNYLKGIVLHFDFGTSYRSGKPVFDSILALSHHVPTGIMVHAPQLCIRHRAGYYLRCEAILRAG